MTICQVANNVAGLELAKPRAMGSDTFVLASGADLLPLPPFRMTAVTAATYQTSAELLTIFEAKSVVGNTITVSGPIEGTVDRAFAVGDKIDLRLTAGTIQDLNAAVTALQAAAAFPAQRQIFATAGNSTYTVPTGAKFLRVQLIAGGGGGGGGAVYDGTNKAWGGAGGGGGAMVDVTLGAADVIAANGSANVPLTVGAGGAGGAGASGGTAATVGGNGIGSRFGNGALTFLLTDGGVGGSAGANGGSSAPAGGRGGNSLYGGTTGTASDAPNSASYQLGAIGGGGGGSFDGTTAKPGTPPASNYGLNHPTIPSGGTAGTGTTVGGDGGNAGQITSLTNFCVGALGGAGGGAAVGANGGNGGSCTGYGGGGGGGGAGAQGFSGGAGGKGGDGVVVIYAW